MREKSWKINPQVVARRIGDETVLVPTGRDIVDLQCLFSLNDTGSFIWEQLSRSSSFDQIVSALMDEFDVTHEEAVQDLTQFLDLLAKEGCILEDSDRPGC